jgi:hypothetical protein
MDQQELIGFEVFNVEFCSSESKQPLRDVCFENGAVSEPFFYLLTKKEQVSANKQILLRSHEPEPRVFCVRASNLVGMFGATIPGKLEPSQVPDHDVFVESTSRNRNLDAGCEAAFFGRATKRLNLDDEGEKPRQILVGVDMIASGYRAGQAVVHERLDVSNVVDGIPKVSQICADEIESSMQGDVLITMSVSGVLSRVGPQVNDFYILPLSEVEVRKVLVSFFPLLNYCLERWIHCETGLVRRSSRILARGRRRR